VFEQANIPTWVFWVIAVPSVPIAGFLAWRDEHAKVVQEADGQRLERERQDNALASKVADEYVALARSRRDGGPHALATLGLHMLGSDALIRQAIREMHARSGSDPWSGAGRFAEDVDLVRFFGWVSDHHPDFHMTSVEEVAKQVQAAGGHRRKTA